MGTARQGGDGEASDEEGGDGEASDEEGGDGEAIGEGGEGSLQNFWGNESSGVRKLLCIIEKHDRNGGLQELRMWW